MACFIVPTTEAVVTTIVTKVISKKEKTNKEGECHQIKLSEKMGWLNTMLWGGSALLAFEHLWHGEIVPWFPFLTAAASPEDTVEMLHEMATTGVGMALIVTAVWVCMVLITSAYERKNSVKGIKEKESLQ